MVPLQNSDFRLFSQMALFGLIFFWLGLWIEAFKKPLVHSWIDPRATYPYATFYFQFLKFFLSKPFTFTIEGQLIVIRCSPSWNARISRQQCYLIYHAVDELHYKYEPHSDTWSCIRRNLEHYRQYHSCKKNPKNWKMKGKTNEKLTDSAFFQIKKSIIKLVRPCLVSLNPALAAWR